MTPTQPKDAEMDEKKFPPRFVIKYGLSQGAGWQGSMQAAFNSDVDNEWNYEAMTVLEHQHILSEERARLEEAVDVLKYALDSDEFYCECCEDAYGVVAKKCARCAVMIFVAKLKSPGERDQPTEDKSGDVSLVEDFIKNEI